jgi:hypothetical protein
MSFRLKFRCSINKIVMIRIHLFWIPLMNCWIRLRFICNIFTYTTDTDYSLAIILRLIFDSLYAVQYSKLKNWDEKRNMKLIHVRLQGLLEMTMKSAVLWAPWHNTLNHTQLLITFRIFSWFQNFSLTLSLVIESESLNTMNTESIPGMKY